MRNRQPRFRGAVSLTGMLSVAVSAAFAQPQGSELSTVDAQRQARLMDRDADRARARVTSEEIERLRTQLVGLGRAEASGERTVGGARSQLRRINNEEAELKVRMGHNQESLTRLLGALETYQRNPPPPLLVDPRSARDAVRAAILIRAITPELEDRSRSFASQSEALKRVRRRAAAASGALFQAESDVADRRAQIEDLIEQKRALEKQLHADADAAETDIRRLASRARSLGEFVSSLDSRTSGADQGSAVMPHSLVVPVQGSLTRRFGEHGPDRVRAKGWTWTTDANAQVLSPAAGRVDYAGPLKGWGVVLILRVGDHHLVLAGLASVSVDNGRNVSASEPVGRMSDGPGRPDLYLEVRQGARTEDPSRWYGDPPATPPQQAQAAV